VLITRTIQAESALDMVRKAGLLDLRRKVVKRCETVLIPIRMTEDDLCSLCLDIKSGGICSDTGSYGIASQLHPQFYESCQTLEQALAGILTEQEISLIPRGWYILGDVVVVKINPALHSRRRIIGEALLSVYPRCKCVLADDGIEGQLRKPVRETIAGEGTITTHVENGIRFQLDASRIMFSPGNLNERIRMSRTGKGERVVDMFAGIGYFSIPMAVNSRPISVRSIELNPVAYGFLEENIRLNNVSDIVTPVLGDCKEMTPVDGTADRVIMGMVGITNRYLDVGIRALASGGVLHYHQTVPSWLYPKAIEEEVIMASKALGRKACILQCNLIKKYAPGVVHAVVDARIQSD
jgi:tRNA wybutosine-synthesizing protein 2